MRSRCHIRVACFAVLALSLWAAMAAAAPSWDDLRAFYAYDATKPPEATVLSTEDSGTYTVENISLKSVNDQVVPTTLCRPKGVEKPPVLLVLHGYGGDGKSFAVPIAAVLAPRGIAVLAIDAQYQGGRKVEGKDIWLNPISGGTDFAGAFVAGMVTLPVVPGEMQVRCLGAAVEAWSEPDASGRGRPLIDEVGELVCVKPMPSMPLRFWGDADGSRYHDSYFDMYPGIWRHGDWIRITPRGGAIIYGRSDATINRHGIRMGTAELYRAVEALPEVLDSLVVDLEYLGRESYMPLFVVLREGVVLDAALTARMKAGIRDALSARHVPNEIFQVEAVPRTLSGKKMELPVKKLLMGTPAEQVFKLDAMANAACVAWFVDFAAQRSKA